MTLKSKFIENKTKFGKFETLFFQTQKITVNDFMDVMMNEPGPHCLVWLPLLHRLASVESGKFSSGFNPVYCRKCQPT